MTARNVVRTMELRSTDPYVPPATDPASKFYQHPYTKKAGWEVLAGMDITDKRYKTTRYMLVYNPTLKNGNRAAILTASGQERTKWVPFAEGKAYDMAQLFDRLDGTTGALDG